MIPCFKILRCSKGCFAIKHVIVRLFSCSLLNNIFLEPFANRSVFFNNSCTTEPVVWKMSRTDSCNNLGLVMVWKLSTSVAEVYQTCPLLWVHILSLLVFKVLDVTLAY
jgi:hypothetical protein